MGTLFLIFSVILLILIFAHMYKVSILGLYDHLEIDELPPEIRNHLSDAVWLAEKLGFFYIIRTLEFFEDLYIYLDARIRDERK